MARIRVRLASAVAALGLLLTLWSPPAGAVTPSSQWKDVQPGGRAWYAHAAIDAVALNKNWMRDYGQDYFRPTAPETREQFARALVRAFAPTQAAASGLTFTDVSNDDTFYPYVNVAVSHGWMTAPNGEFAPTAPVDEFTVSKALVRALGLGKDVKGANGIHLHDGTVLAHPGRFGVYLIGRVLGLWYNHDSSVKGDSEAFDILPGQPVPRDDVAWALRRASTLGSSAHWTADQYANIDLGNPSVAAQQAIEFGLKYVGYPYVYAGEWYKPTGVGYCCGTQLQGGFDCSGFTWWILRAPDSVWSNVAIRKYKGWILPQRSSYDMAGAIKVDQRVPYGKLRPGDIMLYGSSKAPSTIYHVDTYIGGGWALDSGGNGVSIVKVSSGWYRDTFQYGRHLKPAS
jgi:cell wall-associated NlpC family hydrolase